MAGLDKLHPTRGYCCPCFIDGHSIAICWWDRAIKHQENLAFEKKGLTDKTTSTTNSDLGLNTVPTLEARQVGNFLVLR